MAEITLDIEVGDVPTDLYAEIVQEIFEDVELEVCGKTIFVNIGDSPGSYNVPIIKMHFGEIGYRLMLEYTEEVKSWETVGDGKDRRDSALKGIKEFIRVAETLKQYFAEEEWYD